MSRKRRKSKKVSDLEQSNQQHPNKKPFLSLNDRELINAIKLKINKSKIGYTHRTSIESKLQISLNKNAQVIIKQHFNILFINNISFLIYYKHNVNLMTIIYYAFVEKYTGSCKNNKA
eukprot:34124_1